MSQGLISMNSVLALVKYAELCYSLRDEGFKLSNTNFKVNLLGNNLTAQAVFYSRQD